MVDKSLKSMLKLKRKKNEIVACHDKHIPLDMMVCVEKKYNILS